MARSMGTPKTPTERTLAAAAYAVYEERRRAGRTPEEAWGRVTAVVDAKIVPYFVQHQSEGERSA